MKDYSKIINLPHHQSATRKRMSNYDRAAQFAPFAALTGHDEAIKETARLTDDYMEMGEDRLGELSAKIKLLIDKLSEQPEITVVYFIPDERKSGGSYAEKTGVVRIIDEYERKLVFYDSDKILIDRVADFKGEIFSQLE
ncbi:MAG: hypothetical protein IJ366_02775 [Clostridia bacterium]|nr:hypothetical protein [Clostridia bacterium]